MTSTWQRVNRHGNSDCSTGKTWLFWPATASAGSPMATGREWGYVTASRHREALHLYSDAASIEELAPQWARAYQKDVTLDYEVSTVRERTAAEGMDLGR